MPSFEEAHANLALVVNGPNLNALGRRDPEHYGSLALSRIEELTAEAAMRIGWRTRFVQSNAEGELIGAIQSAADEASGIVINAGAYTHTSVAIRDALVDTGLPVVEVHLSNVHAREPFRRVSFISEVAIAVLAGTGWRGYGYAVELLAERIDGREVAA